MYKTKILNKIIQSGIKIKITLEQCFYKCSYKLGSGRVFMDRTTAETIIAESISRRVLTESQENGIFQLHRSPSYQVNYPSLKGN